jgi:hypothetical protein
MRVESLGIIPAPAKPPDPTPLSRTLHRLADALAALPASWDGFTFASPALGDNDVEKPTLVSERTLNLTMNLIRWPSAEYVAYKKAWVAALRFLGQSPSENPFPLATTQSVTNVKLMFSSLLLLLDAKLPRAKRSGSGWGLALALGLAGGVAIAWARNR